MSTWVKRLIKIFAVTFLFLFILVSLVPTILSQSSVQQFLISKINQRIPGKVYAAGIQLGWTTGLDVQDIKLKDAQGRSVAECKRIHLDRSLLSLITSPLSLGHLAIDSPKCMLIEEADGSFSIENAFGSESAEEKAKKKKKNSEKKYVTKDHTSPLAPFLADISVEGGQLQLKKADSTHVEIADFACKISIQGTKDAKVSLTADIVRGKENGKIALDLQAKDYETIAQFYEEKLCKEVSKPISSNASLALNCSLNKFPLDLVDSIVSISDHKLKGLIPAALGDTLNFNLKHTLQDQKLDLHLAVESAYLNAKMDAETLGNTLQISSPATLRFQIDPSLAKTLEQLIPQLKSFTLLQPAAFQLALQPTSLPLPLSSTSAKIPLSLNYGTEMPFLIMKKGWEKELNVQLTGSVSAESIYDYLHSQMRLQLQSGINQATLTAEVAGENILNADAKAKSTITIAGNLAPLTGLFIEEQSLPTQLLGRDLTVKLQCEATNLYSNLVLNGSAQINSETIKEDATFSMQDNTLVVSPFSFAYQMTPDRLQGIMAKMAKQNPALANLPQLGAPLRLKMNAETMSFPLAKPLDGTFLVKMMLDPFDIKGHEQLEGLQIKKVEINLLKEKKEELNITSNIELGLQNMPQPIPQIVGKDISLSLASKVQLAEQKIPELLAVSCDVHSDNLSLKGAKGTPFEFKLQLTPDAFLAALKQKPNENISSIVLKDVATIKLVLDPINDFTNLKLVKGKLTVENLGLIAKDQTFGNYSVALPFEVNLPKSEVKASCDVAGMEPGDETKLKAQFFVAKQEPKAGTKETLLPAITVKTDGSFEHLPLKALAQIVKKEELASLVGDFLSGNWKVDYQGPDFASNTVQATVLAKDLELSLGLNIGSGKISGMRGGKPFSFKTKLTPERFSAALKTFKLARHGKHELILSEEAPVELNASALQFPLALLNKETSLGNALDSLELASDLKVGKLTIKAEGATRNYVILPLTGSASLAKGTKKIFFELKNEQAAQHTHIFLKGQVSNLWDDKGLNPEQSNVEIESRLQNIPLDLLEHISSTKDVGEKLAVVIGPNLDARLKATLSQLKEGELHGTVSGAHMQSEISSSVRAGKLYLNKPCTVKLELTPKAGKVLFKDVNPLLATGVQTDHPVEVYIDNKDFVIPITPFVKNGIQIKKVKIDLGKLKVKKGGALDAVSALLNLNNANEMDLWFTPLYLEVRNGLVLCSRVDALLDNSVQIASWGTIDIANDRVDMVVGILGQGLIRSLRLEGLDPNYVLQLPLKGTTSNATIDKTRATAKIASLRMREATNQTQALIGGLIGLAAQAGEKEGPVPPPTTFPFPWGR